MSWSLIDSDGLSETWSHIDSSGQMRIVDRQDDKPLLDRNQALRSSESTIDSAIRPIASIPITLAEKWVREAGMNPYDFWQLPSKEQNKFFAKKYKSSDYQDLRTTPKLITKLWYSSTHYKAVDIPSRGLVSDTAI